MSSTFDASGAQRGGERSARRQRRDCPDRLGAALAFWRGAPLADFALEPFAQTEIARLEELRLVRRGSDRGRSRWDATRNWSASSRR